MSRQGLPEYLIVMRKPGDNPEAITHSNESFPVGEWQKYASPIWMDINPSDTLQSKSCRDEKDEKHICPLQLSVIRRAIDLWSNPGETVATPFLGIGSEAYVALQRGRRAIGCELKTSWFEQAVRNCQGAVLESTQIGFDL
jgi:DNA modification methylase